MTQTTESINPYTLDYGNLPANVVEAAEAVVSRIRDRIKTGTIQQIENGCDLLATRQRLGKDLFKVWLDRYFDGSEYLARNLIKVAELVQRIPHRIDQMAGWSISALAALSGGSDRLAEKILTDGDRPSATMIRQRVRTERTGKPAIARKPTPKRFSQEEVDRKIAEAIAQKDQELATLRIQLEQELQDRVQAEFRKARDAGLLAAKTEVAAAQEVREELVTKNAELADELEQKQAELAGIAQLHGENQLKDERIADLEAALEQSRQESWENTFNEEAAKVVNADLEKAYQPLVEKLDRMTQKVAQQEEELQRYRQGGIQAEESQVAEETGAIASDFGQLAETLELPGWSGRGYRASDGMLYTNLVSAISHFIQDFEGNSSSNSRHF
ncbi:hypothetical protein J0895_18755 [Phormidium pseudopriestleyi FRX01]|uniref:Chromosome partition protein Smc n=1 Tax=Phormidium pseudopriestleyi FRX01 TaxID=1759528 RepID=A0ABS3FVJ2_9CYAN|nr:hypothetical protein [Phormidium pseudopriestleyi]MBO0351073.1 hypothetical protein [Phormidium pseudopriestleyi FRX01]